MPDLTKTRTVLPLASDLNSVAHAWFQQTPDEDEGGLATRVMMNVDAWADMGRPDQITVTIEPGDLLNASGDTPTDNER